MKTYGFPKREKLKSRKAAEELFKKGSSVFLYPYKVLWYEAPEGTEHSFPKVLFSVPKRSFKKAVIRNRIKRQMREAYRLNKPEILSTSPLIGHLAFIFVGKKEELSDFMQSRMRKVLQKLSAEALIGTDTGKALRVLKEGGLCGIPTETVYGLAANALNPEAVSRIFEAKKRPRFDPLIVHISGIKSLNIITESVPDEALRLAEAFWPGPLTLVLPRKHNIPDLVTSGLDTVAVRVPAHPQTRNLLEKLDFPLAAPSANPFGYISPTSAEHVFRQLHSEIDYILDGGKSAVGVESTIMSFNDGKAVILRKGGLEPEKIGSVLGYMPEIKAHSSSNPKAPGMLRSHYAPRVPLIVGNPQEVLERFPEKQIAVLSFSDVFEAENLKMQCVLSPKRDLKEAAQNLFAALRELDRSGAELIAAEKVPDEGLGFALNDRLLRASSVGSVSDD